MKIRNDFVSNSSSSSFIMASNTNIDNVKKIILDTCGSDYQDANCNKLNEFFSKYTAVFFTNCLTTPIGVPDEILNEFMDNGVIKNETKLKEFMEFLRGDQPSEKHNKQINTSPNAIRWFKRCDCGKINSNSIAMLEWAHKHNFLWDRQKAIDNYQSCFDFGIWDKNDYDSAVADLDYLEDNYNETYSKIMDAYSKYESLVFVTLGYEGDGNSWERLYVLACPPVWDKQIDIVTYECL